MSVFADFFQWKPQPPRSAAQLAETTARLCRLLREEVAEQLEQKSAPLTYLANAAAPFTIGASEDPNATVCVFAIEPKEAGRIGGLIRIEVDDDASGSGNVGYSLDDDFQGRGYTTEALKAMVRLGFEALGLERIWATVDTRNARSWKVLERAGFRRESRMSGHRSIRGAPGDSYLYAICK